MLEEEREQQNPDNEPEMTASEFVSRINNLRENTVSREEYERVRNDNRELAKALINGTGANIPGITKPENKPDLDDLRKKLLYYNSEKRK